MTFLHFPSHKETKTMSVMKAALHAVRPANHDDKFFPDDGTDGSTVMFLRESCGVRHKQWSDDLWMFGERKYRNTDGQVAFKSMAVRVDNFLFYAYIDATGLDQPTIASLIDKINDEGRRNERQPPPITRYDMVMKRRFVGFDYDAYLASGRTSLQRPMIRVYLRNPSVLWGLKEYLTKPIRDHRNLSHQLNMYHADYDFGNLFVYTENLELQNWCRFPAGSLRPMMNSTKSTVCHEEYSFAYSPGMVELVDRLEKPFLCATTRLRVSSQEAHKLQKPQGAVAGEEEVQGDRLIALCSDIYWVGHVSPVVRIRLYCENPLARDHSPMEEEDSGQFTPSDEDAFLISRKCIDSTEMLKIWKAVLNNIDVGVLTTMHDTGHDLLHLLFRDPLRNLSKFKDLKAIIRPSKKPGCYWYSVPGRTQVILDDFLKKMQIKPQFDGYHILAAYHHPKVYHGPKRVSLENHAPNSAAFMTGEACVRECGLEAEILRFIEQGSNILADAAALSRVTTTDLTRIVSNGQQVRVENRFQHDCHKKGFYINKELLQKPPLVVPSAQYNSFPDPPLLPNVSLRHRTADYNRRFSETVASTSLPPGMPFVKIKDAPDPTSFPPVNILPALDSQPKYPTSVKVDKYVPNKLQLDLFGREISSQPNPKRHKGAKAKPKKVTYSGGHVAKPMPQFYDLDQECIALLDFASLYPSIIQGEILCYCNTCFGDRRVLTDPTLTLKFIEVMKGDCMVLVTHINGVSIETLVPETEKELVSERKRVKRQMNVAGGKVEAILIELGLGKNIKQLEVMTMIRAGHAKMDLLKELVQEMINYVNFDKQQLGCKIVQNAVFGFMGVEKNGRMPLIVLMAAICARGRHMIKCCMWYAIRYYQAAVVYG
jgi:hypothetical protein